MIQATLTANFDKLTNSQIDPITLERFRLTLATAVPICIADLQKIGGPSDWHFEQAALFSDELGAKGDTLLYRVKGETARMMSRFCEVVAIMAFIPGGVKVMGLHFEAKTEEALLEWET